MWFIQVWAVGAAFVGSSFLLFISFMGVRYYAFGHKIQNAGTGTFLTGVQTFRLVLLFGATGALFLLIGVLLLLWEPA